MTDATRIRGFGLEVKLNDRTARLLAGTGSGLTVDQPLAEKAGLDIIPSNVSAGGKTYLAHADKIVIGGMEFHNCAVEVLHSRSVNGGDGVIGMGIFSRFLLTLDYPMRKMAIGPLPSIPGAPASDVSLQTKSASDADGAAQADEPPGPSQASAAPQAYTPRNRYVSPEMADWTTLYHVGPNLLIPVRLNRGPRALFALAPVDNNTFISPDAAREVTKVHADTRTRVTTSGGSIREVSSADQITFEFANLSQKGNDIVAFDMSGFGKFWGVEKGGELGATTLSLLTVRIDFRDGLVKFDYDPHRGYTTHPLK